MKATEILENLKLHMQQGMHKLETCYEIKEIDFLDLRDDIDGAVWEIENIITKLEGGN